MSDQGRSTPPWWQPGWDGGQTAIIDGRGEHPRGSLLERSRVLAGALLGASTDLGEERIGLLLPPGFDHVAVQWAIWRAGGVAVPLAVDSPAPELARLLRDARPRIVVAAPELHARAREAAGQVPVTTPEALHARGRHGELPALGPARRAMMVYTSGTTGEPKGVVTTHGNLAAQVRALLDAWEWSASDRILHVLPLHHVHGIVNALCCSLWSGATCEFHAPGDASGIWGRLASGGISVFMAVPTIYRRLIATWEQAGPEVQAPWASGAAKLRLAVSGSAALPVPTLESWEHITGHRLLERYGMTEIGMALGNPLHGERRPGTVGQPFAGVQARIVEDATAADRAEGSGEIQVRGEQVFLEYWDREAETRAAFTEDGWFRTGDEGRVVDGYWQLLGRRSTDIIKSGGYKVSALEIEDVLRSHPGVGDVAVVGLPDPEWGERVCAAINMAACSPTTPAAIRAWCKERLAPHKVPKDVRFVPRLPRNSMGKVIKVDVRALFAEASTGAVDCGP